MVREHPDPPEIFSPYISYLVKWFMYGVIFLDCVIAL